MHFRAVGRTRAQRALAILTFGLPRDAGLSELGRAVTPAGLYAPADPVQRLLQVNIHQQVLYNECCKSHAPADLVQRLLQVCTSRTCATTAAGSHGIRQQILSFFCCRWVYTRSLVQQLLQLVMVYTSRSYPSSLQVGIQLKILYSNWCK